MVNTSKAEIIAELIARGEPKARATMYATAFCEFRDAQANIDEHGVIVQHPRTSNPITNPYVEIRDRAAKRLDGLRKTKSDFLW